MLAAATTAGVLVGLGRREHAALLPFVGAGRALVASLSGLTAPTWLSFVLGAGVHLLWMLLWGVCFALLAASLGGLALFAAGVLFTVLVGALSATVVPGALGAAAAAGLTVPQTTLLLLLFGATLIAGTRIARHRG
jgi:hypothetical protein